MLNAKAVISIAIEICTIHLYLLYIVLKQIAGKEEESEREEKKHTNSNWEMVKNKQRYRHKFHCHMALSRIQSVCLLLSMPVFMRTVLACGLLFALY